jgi:hypothetical protein
MRCGIERMIGSGNQLKEVRVMPRGGARPGAGRKAQGRPSEPLLTYSLTLRLSDVGVLNRLRHGNLSLGLRRLVDQAKAREVAGSPKR